ncbi:tRNA (guanine(37)-N1)-methyltransferase [Achroia grisella]|uniref:tRNA (guanine(37)-N1)-methyltransferase n=1 Tax=Achroia grisella TaxID=688607 RepID=UPI0027D280A8|nr:tRNA (guanine(37)-N1)-methyltransferase [Achroia grisella]
MNVLGFRVFFRKMSTLKNFSLIPVGVRGMKVLDRMKFLRNIEIPLIKVSVENLSKIRQHCKQYFLKLDNFKPVQDFEDEKFKKCIYLNPETITQWGDISESVRDALFSNGIDENNYSTKVVQLTYENWRFDAIFKAVLPENEEIVSSFSQIGHIIHLNLREHLIEYRQLIGQVLVDKIKTCRTVVNKSNIIDNTYRNFSMEVIAGDEDYLVTVKENNCIFEFDFSKVYWNPRLCREHERILALLKPGDVLFDVFCGVGPFSIPAAKRKCTVYANDLNPDSFKWLNHNAKKNKIILSLFKSYNLDGKDFIYNIFKDYLIEYCNQNKQKGLKIHVTMNLPAMAVQFLKYFKGLIDDKQHLDKFDCEIIVYVYCFAVGDDPDSIARTMINDSIGCDMSKYIMDVFDVRNVSPKKEMMRVTIKLTKEVLFDTNIYEPPNKKLCVND